VPAAGLLHCRRHGRADPQGQHHALARAAARPIVSYPAAAAAGSLLAVCSCTIVPLFAGIYRKGAGSGRRSPSCSSRRPATSWRWPTPAASSGAEFAFARLLLCLLFGIGIGMLMALLFWRDDASHDAQTDTCSPGRRTSAGRHPPAAVAGRGADRRHAEAVAADGHRRHASPCRCPGPRPGRRRWSSWVPFDAAKGEEGVSVQGSLLIVLLLLIGLSAWKGLEDIIEGANRWTWVALGWRRRRCCGGAAADAPQAGWRSAHRPRRGRGRLAVGGAAHARRLEADDWRGWLWEAWRFVKQIFPLLVVGVFVVGIVRQLIRPNGSSRWPAQRPAGQRRGRGFGVFMYFPTLVEVPVARMFLDLGMHPGPLLAYLMADPELSLQSMLMVAAVIGRPKTFAYVGLVALFSILAGLLYGAWVDGVNPGWIVAGLGTFVATLTAVLNRMLVRRAVAARA
jgi:uncharacterized protein